MNDTDKDNFSLRASQQRIIRDKDILSYKFEHRVLQQSFEDVYQKTLSEIY